MKVDMERETVDDARMRIPHFSVCKKHNADVTITRNEISSTFSLCAYIIKTPRVDFAFHFL